MISPSRRGPATADLLIRGIVSAPLHRNRRRPNTPAIVARAQHLGERFGSAAGHAEVGVSRPSGRFSTARTTAEQDLLPLRLAAVIALAPLPGPVAGPEDPPPPTPSPVPRQGELVEFDRVVTPSVNIEVLSK